MIIDFLKKLFAAIWESITKKDAPILKPSEPAGEQLELPTYLPLAWEKNHTERVPWSTYTLKRIEELWPSLSKVKDMTYFRSDWHELTKREQINVFGEFIAWLAYYESSWDPKASSTDVGEEDDINTHSRGLLQVSQVDQANYKVWSLDPTGKKYSYTAAELLEPIKNINLGLMLLACLIEKDGLLRRKRGNWITWATLAPGNQYDKSVVIAAKVNAFPIKANRKPAKTPQEPSNTPRLPDKAEATPITPPWMTEAKKYSGKTETDPTFSKFMIGRIKALFGMVTNTIATSTWAWCGFAIAVALSGASYDYQKNGEMATYGTVINWKQDGIPEGAIVRINHKLDCSSESSNHVSMANGDCAPGDLTKSGATIDLYGGNQGNTWKVSNYSAKEICNVRWPTKPSDPNVKWIAPRKITKSVKCTSAKTSNETTR
jgi:hypothetical protein